MPTSVHVAWHGKKCHVAPHFYHLYLRNAMMPLASSDTYIGTNAITWSKNDAPHFAHLDIRNVMLLLTMPSASCDADQKCHVALDFDQHDQRSAMVTSTMLFASHDVDVSTNDIFLPRKLCCTTLLSSWSKKYNGAISIMWHWHLF